MNQIPSVSQSRLNSMQSSMREAYRKMSKVRDEIVRERVEKAAEIESTVVPKYKKGDWIRVKVDQPVNSCKKRARPWSEKKYKVIKVLPYVNSLLVEEESCDPKVRPSRSRVHMRFAKKVMRRENLLRERRSFLSYPHLQRNLTPRPSLKLKTRKRVQSQLLRGIIYGCENLCRTLAEEKLLSPLVSLKCV